MACNRGAGEPAGGVVAPRGSLGREVLVCRVVQSWSGRWSGIPSRRARSNRFQLVDWESQPRTTVRDNCDGTPDGRMGIGVSVALPIAGLLSQLQKKMLSRRAGPSRRATDPFRPTGGQARGEIRIGGEGALLG